MDLQGVLPCGKRSAEDLTHADESADIQEGIRVLRFIRQAVQLIEDVRIFLAVILPHGVVRGAHVIGVDALLLRGPFVRLAENVEDGLLTVTDGDIIHLARTEDVGADADDDDDGECDGTERAHGLCNSFCFGYQRGFSRFLFRPLLGREGRLCLYGQDERGNAESKKHRKKDGGANDQRDGARTRGESEARHLRARDTADGEEEDGKNEKDEI